MRPQIILARALSLAALVMALGASACEFEPRPRVTV
jgi:hypothetical protein